MKTLILILLFLFATYTSAAETKDNSLYVTGMQLLENCQDPHLKNTDSYSAMQSGVCLGYIMAVVDATSRQTSLRQQEFKNIFCATNVDAKQLVLIVKKYLENNPELLSLIAADIVNAALRKAFPC